MKKVIITFAGLLSVLSVASWGCAQLGQSCSQIPWASNACCPTDPAGTVCSGNSTGVPDPGISVCMTYGAESASKLIAKKQTHNQA